jgi:hypothetical protein
VDETLAPLFGPAPRRVITGLERLLKRDTFLMLISGQSVENIYERLIRWLHPQLRAHIVVSHCNGAETFGFDADGLLIRPALVTSVAACADVLVRRAATVLRAAARELGFRCYTLMPVHQFRVATGGDPTALMVDERRVQVSANFVNWIGCSPQSDLRDSLLNEVNHRLRKQRLTFVARHAGAIGVDVVYPHVDKSLPPRAMILLDSTPCRPHRHIHVDAASEIEVWGDRFTSSSGATDLAILHGLPPGVSAINFRPLEKTDRLPDGVRQWSGKWPFYDGVAEYLASLD